MWEWLPDNWDRILAIIIWLVLADDTDQAIKRGWPPLRIVWQASTKFTINVWSCPWPWLGGLWKRTVQIWGESASTAHDLWKRIHEGIRGRLDVTVEDKPHVVTGYVILAVLLVMAAADAVVLGYSFALTGMANEILPIGPGIPVAPVLAIILALFHIGAGVALGTLKMREDTPRSAFSHALWWLVVVTITGEVVVSFLRGWALADNAPLAIATVSAMRPILALVLALIAAGLAGGEFEMARQLHPNLMSAGIHAIKFVLLIIVVAVLVLLAITTVSLSVAVLFLTAFGAGAATAAVASSAVIACSFLILAILTPIMVAHAVLLFLLVANWVPYRLHHWLRLPSLGPIQSLKVEN